VPGAGEAARLINPDEATTALSPWSDGIVGRQGAGRLAHRLTHCKKKGFVCPML
jgi:hypothetical protein